MYEVRRIGLAIDAVAAYGRGVIRGIMSYCRAHPNWVIAVEPMWSFGTLPAIHQWDVDGLIVQTYSREFEEQVLKRGIPATNVSNFCEGDPLLPTVIPDDAAVGKMGAEYLLSLGFRELGFCGPSITPYCRLRLEAFRKRAAEAGVRLHDCDTSSQELGPWLSKLPKPAGVMGTNDDWAHRALIAAHRTGIRVPDEVAMLGVDNDELFNALVTPSLSSIAVPAEQVGVEAATLLDRVMDGEKLSGVIHRVAPVCVVPRASTDVLNVSDPEVALAIRFIRENVSQPLQVDDLLDHVPLSRRSLERRFRQAIGRSISAEIRRAHVEQAKSLLIETDLSMPQIASASGFTSATRLGVVFLKEAGETPTGYRQRSRAGGGSARLHFDQPTGAAAPVAPAIAIPKANGDVAKQRRFVGK